MSKSIAKMREDHRKALKDLEAFQEKMKDPDFTPEASEAERMESIVEEAAGLQSEILAHEKRQRRIQETLEESRKIGDPVIPDDHQPDDPVVDFGKGGRNRGIRTKASDGKRAIGFVSLGKYVVAQEGLRKYRDAGMPKQGAMLATVPSLFHSKRSRGGEVLVPISHDQLKMIEAKAVPTIGADVIEPTLDPDLVRVTENDQLRLRDVLNIGQTSSDAVKYTRIVSYTRAAATVANSAQKPEAEMEMDSVTEAVRTIAVHIPVEEQQLSDIPALAGLINGELLYDVEKHVEELVMYGDGVGENFNGILKDSSVLDARTEGSDTLIDVARRGITDVRRAGYTPNGILIDPLDWEDVVLEKGSDNRYVWVVVTDGATQRLWAVPVVETEAMEDYAGNPTEERNMLVGDFQRGATLWDRETASISVGWINDQFIRNQRTILAELRAAFGVKRPGAFRKHETQAAVTS